VLWFSLLSFNNQRLEEKGVLFFPYSVPPRLIKNVYQDRLTANHSTGDTAGLQHSEIKQQQIAMFSHAGEFG